MANDGEGNTRTAVDELRTELHQFMEDMRGELAGLTRMINAWNPINGANRNNNQARDRGIPPIQPAVAIGHARRYGRRAHAELNDEEFEEFDDYEFPAREPPRNFRRGDRRDDNETTDFRLKIDIPPFDGYFEIEEYLDWESTVDKFFNYTRVPEENQAQYVSYKLTGGASVWWDQLQENRRRQGRLLIRRWSDMKEMLHKRFLPKDYEQVLYHQYQNCRQGGRSIRDYSNEFLRLNARNNLAESDNQ